jgi:hypothetical protein
MVDPTWSSGGNVERCIERMFLLSQFAEAVHSAGAISPPFAMFELAFARFRSFSAQSVRRLETETEWLSLDVTGHGLSKNFAAYGVGDTVETALGKGVILGGVVEVKKKELPPPPVEQGLYRPGMRHANSAASQAEAEEKAKNAKKEKADKEVPSSYPSFFRCCSCLPLTHTCVMCDVLRRRCALHRRRSVPPTTPKWQS